jgi:hypothetical protein
MMPRLTERVRFSLPETEKDELRRRANELGMSMSVLLRLIILPADLEKWDRK